MRTREIIQEFARRIEYEENQDVLVCRNFAFCVASCDKLSKLCYAAQDHIPLNDIYKNSLQYKS